MLLQLVAKGADALVVEAELCLVQALTANPLVQIEESHLCFLANEGKPFFSLATICSSQIESVSVASLIGTPSPSSCKISNLFFFLFTFLCLHPQHFYSLLPKGAFYFYYKNLILFDDRHLMQCLYS